MKTRKKGFFNPLKVKELRRKMLLIIGVMFIIRLLNQIPTPGVNHDYLKQILGGSGAMGFMDLMTGGSLSSLSILALNISPYITASIVIELLSIVFKQLDEMKRDGKHGQEELKKITLYSAIGLSFIQALAMSVGFGRKGMLTHFTWYWVLIITLIWTASAGALAFVGNYMTEKKLCNGVSLILACNILSGVLDDLFSLWETAFTGHKTAQGILYIQKSKYIWILTPDEVCKYEIFSCYTAEVGSDTYTLIKGPGKGLVEYAEKMQAKDTLGLTRLEFDVKDKVITLSTCTGNEATRYVVQAVKIEP